MIAIEYTNIYKHCFRKKTMEKKQNTMETFEGTANQETETAKPTKLTGRTEYCVKCKTQKKEFAFMPFDEDNNMLVCNSCQGD